MQKEKLYICLSDDKKDLFLLGKSEVEKSIKGMEENFDNELSYSVLGGINPSKVGIPYLLTFKMEKSPITWYEVVNAPSGIEAHSLLLGMKRFKNDAIKVTNTLDLRKLINEYYE